MTAQERWIYRDMLDVYYDTEGPFPDNLDKICAMVGARRDGDREIVASILLLKFTLAEDGYRNERCDVEIADYRKKAVIAKVNGGKGGRPVKNNPEKPSGLSVGSYPVASGNPIGTGSQANQEPITNNHKPVTKEKPSAPPCGDAVLFPGVDAQVVADFKALRKQKRAAVTKTAMDKIAAEAVKAGLTLEAALQLCCSRGWQGFEAAWVASQAAGRRADQPAKPSRHSGFDQLDYQEGVSDDGRF